MWLIARLARAWENIVHGTAPKGQVDALFASASTPAEFSDILVQEGFSWAPEWDWLDWNRAPEESLNAKDRKINCGDFAELYAEFFKRKNIRYQKLLLEEGSKWLPGYHWHYITLFHWDNACWCQSNNTLIKLEGAEHLLVTLFSSYTRAKKC